MGVGKKVAVLGFVAVLLFVAVLPVVDRALDTRQRRDSAAAVLRGRNLFTGISRANVERHAAGLPDLWPRTAGSADLSADRNDIAGIPFKNSTDYFRTLFDIAAKDSDKWNPYVDFDVRMLKGSEQSGYFDWIVAANVKDEFDDVVPVLISANVDPSVLKTSFDGHDDTPIPIGSKVGRTKLPWCDKYVVVIKKGGVSQVFKAKYFTYSNLYDRKPFFAPGLKYLDVE